MASPAESGPAESGPADDAGAGPAGAGPRRRRRALAETASTIVVAVLLAGLVRALVVQVFWIPSSSMVPTLSVYDRILVQKAFVTWRDVREGDIVVFSHPPLDHCPGPQGGDLVKRVIALPGQTIYSSGSSIYVNGRLLAEPYLPRYDPLGRPVPDASSQHPYRVTSTCWATTGRSPATAGTGGRSRARASSARRCWCGGTTATQNSARPDPGPRAAVGYRLAPGTVSAWPICGISDRYPPSDRWLHA
jgi:signal peptidase I